MLTPKRNLLCSSDRTVVHFGRRECGVGGSGVGGRGVWNEMSSPIIVDGQLGKINLVSLTHDVMYKVAWLPCARGQTWL